MRLEDHCPDRGSVASRRLRHIENGAMSTMDAIEIADGERGALQRVRNVVPAM
jgi:hypothetical protein